MDPIELALAVRGRPSFVFPLGPSFDLHASAGTVLAMRLHQCCPSQDPSPAVETGAHRAD